MYLATENRGELGIENEQNIGLATESKVLDFWIELLS